jgi:D-sedoheptulose 7-phosphate isomerase
MSLSSLSIVGFLDETQRILAELSQAEIAGAHRALLEAWRARRHVFLLGNGGSAATASHLANDLSKATSIEGRPRFRAIALTDNVPLITAWGNDSTYDDVFREQLVGLMDPGDLVLAISASGNSPNVIRAVEYARQHHGVTIGWTGRTGGKLRHLVDHCVSVDTDDVGQIENAHMVLVHLFTVTLRAALKAEVLDVATVALGSDQAV